MRAAALAIVLAGCGPEPLDVEPPGDFTAWGHIEVEDSVVYANDTARSFAGGPYPVGSILIQDFGDTLLLMRRSADGWLFSQTDEPGGDEFASDLCWRYCHVAAPLDGAFLDYSRAMK